MLLVTDFGSRCDANVLGTPASCYGELVKKRSFGLFWPASFVYYYSHILGPAVIRRFQEPRWLVTWNSSKHAVLAYSGQFCMLLLTHFGFRCDPNVSETPVSDYGELVNTRSFGVFRLVLYAIKTHSFDLFSPVLYALTH